MKKLFYAMRKFNNYKERLQQSEMRKLLQIELRIESAEIWYHNCTFSMRNIRQIWIHLVSYVHIHHHIESVHKIAIDAICSKNSILPSFFLFAAPTIMEKFKWLHFFFMFTIHYESQSLLYVCASIIDWWKIHNDRDDQVWQKRGDGKKFNNPFFRQCPFNICQKLLQLPNQRSKKFSILNFFRLLWPFLFFCRYYVSVSICGRAWKIFHLCTLMYKTVGLLGEDPWSWELKRIY